LRGEKDEAEALRQLLLRYFPFGKPIKEINCGSSLGTGYIFKEEQGIAEADADASEARERTQGYYSSPIRVAHEGYPLEREKGLTKEGHYGAVLVTAVMHIPDEDLFDFAMEMRKQLDPGGVLIVTSFAHEGVKRVVRSQADISLPNRPPEELQLLFERIGFRFITRHDVKSNASGKHYYILVMENSEGGASRPVDEIEAIIRNDDKKTTFKLALLRALCDIAQNESCLARWRPDGVVEVPMGLVVEKWLFYFWPIIGEDGSGEEVAIPQNRYGEKEKMIRFRKEMRALIAQCGGTSGLTAMYDQFRFGEVKEKPPKRIPYLEETLKRIEEAIRVGPIAYTKGTARDGNRYFGYERVRGQKRRYGSSQDMIETLGSVLVSAKAWREMCLIGHWISESLVLRWAELTSQFSKGDKKYGMKEKTVELLLTRPETERDVKYAKDVYCALSDPRCTWTGRELIKGFEIDHVIPYSVLYNNELWNLVPASKEINRSKSDRLVEAETLERCKERIFGCWEALHEKYPKVFELEVNRSLLRPRQYTFGWMEAAFSGLKEKVENLAVLRGIPRWSPPIG